MVDSQRALLARQIVVGFACVVLATALEATLAATSSTPPLEGGELARAALALFALYVPLGLAAGALSAALIAGGGRIRRLRAIGRIGRRLHQIAGLLMVAMGIAMITGQLSALSYWLLDAFPALGRIG